MSYAAGDVLTAASLNPPGVASNPASVTTDGTTTSAVFTNTLTTTGIHGQTFVAPTSGIVWIMATCGQARSSSAGGVVLTDFEVRTGSTIGSGTVARSSSEPTAGVAESEGANNNRNTVSHGFATGLTAGNTYNACITYRVTAGTATINRRNISIIPMWA